MTINQFKKINSRRTRGFTLLETLVAVAILSITITGPISVISDAVHRMYYAKDQMIAINLAQEGVEVVRKTRDSNMLEGSQWTRDFNQPDYIVDATLASPLIACSGNCDQKVYLDGNGLYRQGIAGTETQFTRIVTITNLGGDERKVTSRVEWRTRGANGVVAVSEYLFKTF